MKSQLLLLYLLVITTQSTIQLIMLTKFRKIPQFKLGVSGMKVAL